jgi:hypothetical protein
MKKYVIGCLRVRRSCCRQRVSLSGRGPDRSERGGLAGTVSGTVNSRNASGHEGLRKSGLW